MASYRVKEWKQGQKVEWKVISRADPVKTGTISRFIKENGMDYALVNIKGTNTYIKMHINYLIKRD